jgi:carotenoid 1,2-hydratase
VKAELSTRDPDRFFRLSQPGSQEWWYFDALSLDGRDALVIVWYAALPFDPSYGVAAVKHLRSPQNHPAPDPLDHCAIGLSWYRDGKTLAYALNGFRKPDFSHSADPFRIDIGGNLLEREANGYRLSIDTPAVDGRSRLRAALLFEPAPRTSPLECNLAADDPHPHSWVLACGDSRVEGQISVDGPKRSEDFRFVGRGYHDHNAGSLEISLAMRRWAWGRVHLGPSTHIYYHCETRSGTKVGLWITCEEGEPVEVRPLSSSEEEGRSGNIFGVRHGQSLKIEAGQSWLRDHRLLCVDDGPFYRRWVTRFERSDGASAPGISELLDTRNLNRPLFNWMIPYRLKRPKP